MVKPGARAVAAGASSPRRALDRRVGHRAGSRAAKRSSCSRRIESTYIPHRPSASHRESRQDPAAHHRGAVGRLPGRGRYRALRGQVRPAEGRLRDDGSIIVLQGLRLRGRIPGSSSTRSRLSRRSCVRGVREAEAGRRRSRHPPVERGAVRCARPRAHRLGRRCVRHRPVRHRGRLLRDLPRAHGRRDHGDREPQSARLQRHEVRARAVAADQRRYRAASRSATSPRRASSPAPARPGRATGARRPAARTSNTCSATSIAAKLKPLKIVVNAGNGGAGLVIDQLEPHLPFEFIKIFTQPDGTFPERRAESDAGREPRADDRGDPRNKARPGHRLGRRLRPLLLLRRAWALHRGLLHRRLAGGRVPQARTRRARSSTTRASPGTRSTSCSRSAASRCCASPGTRSSRRRCATTMRPTAAR